MITVVAQQQVLEELRRQLQPLAEAAGVPARFELQPGVTLRRRYGDCRFPTDGGPPVIRVRCTVDGDRARWRSRSGIVLTLVHELTHLKHRNHGAGFWRLCRRLLDAAAAAGVYDPRATDPAERAQGDVKLARSAADVIAGAALAQRRARGRRNKAALAAWQIGDTARLALSRGRLADQTVRVVGKLRTRAVVQTAARQRFLVPAALLEPVS